MKSTTKHTLDLRPRSLLTGLECFGECFLFNEKRMLQTCKTFLFHPAPQLLSFYLFILPPYQMILTMTSHAEHGK